MRLRTNRTRFANRLIITCSVVVLAVTIAAAPVEAAECGGTGRIDHRGGEVDGECGTESPGEPGSSSEEEQWEANCAAAAGPYREGDQVEWIRSDQLVEGDIEELGLGPSGEYWWWGIYCYRDGSTVYESPEFAVASTPPVSPEVMRDEAAARIDPPAPSPGTSPPLAEQAYVQIPTWLWLGGADWVPIEVSDTRGSVTVTVRSTPVDARWVLGEDGEVTCDGPGTEWLPGMSENDTDCSFTFTHSSYGEADGRFDASVSVVWEFEWWINGVYQGPFGTVDVSTGFEVAVGEIQAVETGG